MSYLLSSAPQAMHSLWKKASRLLLRLRMLFSGKAERLAAERRLRGREQYRKLSQADVVLVSFGKSGRTWLRVMLSRLYQQIYGLPQRALIGFDNFHNVNAAIPRMFFTHDNYIGDYTGHTDCKVDFYNKKVVLLARDPRDVAVSQFFQWKYRMKTNKKAINQYPEHGADVSIYDFVMHPTAGLMKVIGFLNLWAKEAPRVDDLFLLRYEDLKAHPVETLTQLAAFIGAPADDAQIRDAVEFSSYENMKKMEEKKTFWLSGGRMVPKDRSNPNSYKVRRAKVGGYRDYFDDQQVANIEAVTAENLSPFYGYTVESEEPASRAGSA
jgi:alcohol sulfotransferase